MSTTWQERFAELLAGNHAASGDPVDAGAQLVVQEADGTEVFRHALARHHRTEEGDANLIWIRPLVGGSSTPDLGYVFNLNVARRRALHWTEGRLDDNGDVVLHLADTCGDHFMDGYWPAVQLDPDDNVVAVTVES